MAESATYFIRPATLHDEPFLWEMLYQAIYIPPGGEPLPKTIIREPGLSRYVAGWGRAGDLGFIAALGDSAFGESQQPIGAAWSRLLTGENKGYGWVDDATPELSIAIAPGWRGKGIGTTLLKYLVETVRIHYGALSLSVSADNPARSLYERLGFEIVGTFGNSLTMKKRFNGSERLSQPQNR